MREYFLWPHRFEELWTNGPPNKDTIKDFISKELGDAVTFTQIEDKKACTTKLNQLLKANTRQAIQIVDGCKEPIVKKELILLMKKCLLEVR